MLSWHWSFISLNLYWIKVHIQYHEYAILSSISYLQYITISYKTQLFGKLRHTMHEDTSAKNHKCFAH